MRKSILCLIGLVGTFQFANADPPKNPELQAYTVCARKALDYNNDTPEKFVEGICWRAKSAYIDKYCSLKNGYTSGVSDQCQYDIEIVTTYLIARIVQDKQCARLPELYCPKFSR